MFGVNKNRKVRGMYKPTLKARRDFKEVRRDRKCLTSSRQYQTFPVCNAITRFIPSTNYINLTNPVTRNHPAAVIKILSIGVFTL